MAYDLSDLDLARMKRERVAAELDAIAREASPFYAGPDTYRRNAADADIERARKVDRCLRDLERLDETIARLTLDDDEWPEDAGGYDPDSVIDDDWTPNPHTRSEAA